MKVGVIGGGSASLLSMVLRRSAREMVIVNRNRKKAKAVATLPSVVGREGVLEILEPAMSTEEREALDRSAQTLRDAFREIKEQAA